LKEKNWETLHASSAFDDDTAATIVKYLSATYAVQPKS